MGNMITFLGVLSVLTFCSRQAAVGTTDKELKQSEKFNRKFFVPVAVTALVATWGEKEMK